MKKILLTSISLIFVVLFGWSQSLQSFTVMMDSNSKTFLSFSQKKAFTANEAGAVKDDLNLVLVATKENNTILLEWYNMEKHHEKAPLSLAGNKTGISAISFDREQFDKCKTGADLKRMTGHITKSSFSHFAVIRNSSTMQHCFIAEMADGKRSLLYVTQTDNGTLKVEVRSE